MLPSFTSDLSSCSYNLKYLLLPIILWKLLLIILLINVPLNFWIPNFLYIKAYVHVLLLYYVLDLYCTQYFSFRIFSTISNY
jgi:hypothetical protein